jgi:hypothetical protein
VLVSTYSRLAGRNGHDVSTNGKHPWAASAGK